MEKRHVAFYPYGLLNSDKNNKAEEKNILVSGNPTECKNKCRLSKFYGMTEENKI